MVFTYTTALFIMPLASILLLLPGCKQVAYNPKSLKEIRLPHTPLQQDQVTVTCKLLTKSETHLLFDGRGSRLLHKRRPIYPLLLSITNTTSAPLILDPRTIGLRLINPELVAQRLYSHTSRRVVAPFLIGTLCAGATFYAAACMSIFGAVASIPALIKGGYACLGVSGAVALGTPVYSFQQGYGSCQLNSSIYQDVMNKSLHAPVTIEPGTSHTTLLFVPHRAYNTSFTIRLVDARNTDALGYEVAVEEGELPCKK